MFIAAGVEGGGGQYLNPGGEQFHLSVSVLILFFWGGGGGGVVRNTKFVGYVLSGFKK